MGCECQANEVNMAMNAFGYICFIQAQQFESVLLKEDARLNTELESYQTTEIDLTMNAGRLVQRIHGLHIGPHFSCRTT